ncbi:MAG: hypothetical protein IJR92_02480 [Alphaproteobacteria bacterium]|nr:hypothetical protein [Alphaproteobacteria bacterium]
MRISCLTVLCVLTTVSGAFAAPSLVTSANTANVGAVSRAGSLRAVKSNVAVKKYATPEQPSAAANADVARMASIVGGVGKMSGKIPSSGSSTVAGGAMLNSLQKQVSDLSSNYDDLAAQVSNANTRIDAAQTTADTAQTTADTAVAGIDELRNTTVDSGTISALGAALAQKANAADVYTKSESNELLAARATNADLQSAVTQVTGALERRYTKDETDGLLAAKADSATINTLLEQKLDRSELDTLAKKSEVEELSGTIASTNAALAQKADRSELGSLALDAYTKSETDGLLNAKVDNSSFDGYKTEMNAALAQKAGVDQISSLQSAISTKADTSALAQKADAADVYTKSETDTKVADLKSWTDENKLNKSDYDTFVANTGVAIENVYTKSETDAKLAAKANAASIYTRSTIDNKLESKADTSALAQKADAANVYTKTESDATISGLANTYVKKDMGTANKNGILTTDNDGMVTVDRADSGGIFDTLTRFDGDIASLQSDVSDLDGRVDSQDDTISGFGTTLGTYQGQVESLSTDVSNLRDTVGSQGDTISGLSSDVSGLQTDVAANTAALTTKANTADVVSNTDFNTYKNTTTNAVNKISEDVTTLNNTVATKANASDLTTLQNTVSQLQQTVEGLQSTTTSLETQCQMGNK